jgi:hypothetical protein
MLESVGKFHYGYWNVLEMSTVPVDIHMLENSVSPCDIHYSIYMSEFCISPCNSVGNRSRKELDGQHCHKAAQTTKMPQPT